MTKKSVIKILLFTVAVIAGDRLGGGVMQRLFLKTQFRYAQLYKGELLGDIAVLGNSRGLHMFHPPSIKEETGKAVANLAFNGTPTVVLPLLWESYLERHDAPNLLILEVSCCASRDEKGSIERFSILADQNPEFNDLIMKRNPSNGWGNRISRLYRYNSNLMWRSLLFMKRSDQSWIMNTTLNETMLKALVNESENTLGTSEANVAALKRVLLKAKESGVEVKCIFAPYLPDFYERLENPDEWCQWLAAELGVEILNRTQLLDDSKLFSDHLHLNEAGAKALAEKLNQENFFD